MGVGAEREFLIGNIEVELVNTPKDFTQQHGRKYSIWARNNTLYYDKKVGKWLAPREFQTVMLQRANAAIRISERSIQLAEESSKLLRDIIEVLKSKN